MIYPDACPACGHSTDWLDLNSFVCSSCGANMFDWIPLEVSRGFGDEPPVSVGYLQLAGGVRIATQTVLEQVRPPGLHFLSFYDAAPAGDPNRIEPIDWALPSLLNAPVSYRTLQELYRHPEKAKAIDQALATIPEDVTLASDEALGLDSALRHLMTLLCGLPQTGRAVATKILHKKRPMLIPIVDSVVAGFYGLAKPVDVMLGPLRDDLEANASDLGVIAAYASRDASCHIGRLRALEMVVWMTSKQAGSYGLSPAD